MPLNNKRLFSIFLVVFVDLLGFSLILPLLPYYAEQYGATPTVVGLLVASYAAASLIGSPILGRLSDRYGRRPILLLSVFGTLLGFLLLGFAAPLGEALARWLAPSAAKTFVLGALFLSRILDGVTAGNITVAQAYISDVTDEKNRAKGLGLIGAAFGLGFIIGPALGGLLSKSGYNVPAFVAAGVATLNLLAIAFFLPESLSLARREEMAQIQRPSFTLGALLVALRRPIVGPLLHLRFFYGLAFSLFQSIFSLYAQAIGLTSDSTGYVLAYVGLLSVIVQGGLIGVLTKRFRENSLIITGLWVMGLSFVGWALTRNLVTLLIILLPLAVAGGVLNTVIQSALTKSVARDELGGTLGLAGALESVTRVIAPTVGGFLLGTLGIWAPGVFCALALLWSVWFTYRRIVRVKWQTQTA
jgi:DHA1 family tetracycline resistance protein-like MFS transporter